MSLLYNNLRRRSLSVCLLHMGGPNGDALEWEALFTPHFLQRLRKMGVRRVSSVEQAEIVVVTGLLTESNIDGVLAALSTLPASSTLIVAGDAAINGGIWSRVDMPGLSEYPLSHYVDVQITVPGSPPTPQALLAALVAATA